MADAVIDPAVFAELRAATGAEFAAELVTTFFEEAPGMLADLRGAHAKGDADRFRRAAHSLKSNASTFGAVTLAGLARTLELNGPAAEPARAIASLDALDAEYKRAAAALKDLAHG
jgi:histidine phosphotransfer protein HptB